MIPPCPLLNGCLYGARCGVAGSGPGCNRETDPAKKARRAALSRAVPRCPALSCAVVCCRALSCAVPRYPVLSRAILCCPAVSRGVLRCAALRCRRPFRPLARSRGELGRPWECPAL